MRALLYVIGLTVLLGAPAHAQVDRALPAPSWPAYAAMVGGNAADLWTTHDAFSRGAVEGNGILNGHPITILTLSKLSCVLAIGLVMRRLERHGHPRVAKFLGYIDGGVTSAVAWHNARVQRP